MRVSWRDIRVTILSSAVAAAAFAVVTNVGADTRPTTRVGDASVALGDDAARSIERVAYRQDVVRVGDVVVVDGVPRTAIDDPDIAAMWAIVDSLWPTWLDDDLRQFSVVREEPRNLVGVVHPSGGGGWILSLDLADLDDEELVVETLVHELSHVVTLDADGFAFGDGPCDGVAIELGCADDGTVLASFASTFWPEDLPSGEAADHVNDYAMTAAHEDLAETFMAWVLGWPIEGAVVEAKVAHLAADPTLARLASSLRDRLADLEF